TNADLDAVQEMMGDDQDHDGDLDGDLGDMGIEGLLEEGGGEGEHSHEEPPELAGKKLTMASFDDRAGRAALRAKLAADALGKEEDGEIQDMSKQKFS